MVHYLQTEMSLTLYHPFSRNSHFSFSLLGINRYYDNLEMMFGFRIAPVMKICWMFVTPLFSLVSYKTNNACWLKYVIIS